MASIAIAQIATVLATRAIANAINVVAVAGQAATAVRLPRTAARIVIVAHATAMEVLGLANAKRATVIPENHIEAVKTITCLVC